MSDNSVEWTEKYRPVTLDEIVGNRNAIRKMKLWAKGWIEGLPLKKSAEAKEEIMKKKALILSGPPGVGKTSSALALAKELGWSVIELNASDKRSGDVVREIVLGGAITEGFREDGGFTLSRDGERKLIILDEADNLSGKEDRGGVHAIVEAIKNSSQPIILIVNDLYELQRRSSIFKGKSSPVEVIRFKKPSVEDIKKILKKISEKESLNIDENTLYEIAYRSNGDVRGAINDLQSLAYSGITREAVLHISSRDIGMDIKETLREVWSSGNILEGRKMLMNLGEDPGTLMLWVDEIIPKMSSGYDVLFRAYKRLSMADVFLSRVYKRGQYSMWSYATEEIVGTLLLTKDGIFPRSFFPQWLLKMGRSRGVRSIRKSLGLKMAKYMHMTSEKALQDVLPYFGVLFRKDEEFMYSMINKMQLNEKEVEYLIGDAAKAKYAVKESARFTRKDGQMTLIGF